MREDRESIQTRASLISRLKDWDDSQSWREFFDLYADLIYGVARKAGLSEAEAEEAVQETIISVARKMQDFKYDPALGSFKGWLLQLTRWRIYDELRKRQPVANSGQNAGNETSDTALVDRIPSPESLNLDHIWEEDWQRNLLDVAVARAKANVSPRLFQVYDLYVLQEWPAAKVAEALGTTSAQVHLAKHRVNAVLKKEVRRLEKEWT